MQYNDVHTIDSAQQVSQRVKHMRGQPANIAALSQLRYYMNIITRDQCNLNGELGKNTIVVARLKTNSSQTAYTNTIPSCVFIRPATPL